MLYIFESELSNNKRISRALLSIYGIGGRSSKLICNKLGFASNFKIKFLTKKQVTKLIKRIERTNLLLGSELKKSKILINKKFIDINSYKGIRKKRNLPVRGQRTHSNAKTIRKIKN
jgi:small subunit ribosomal protein S13